MRSKWWGLDSTNTGTEMKSNNRCLDSLVASTFWVLIHALCPNMMEMMEVYYEGLCGYEIFH